MSAEPEHNHPAGVEHTGVIDLILHDAQEGTVTLVIVEKRPWDGSDRRLYELQEKLNAYLSFALDGEMAEAYPALMKLPLTVRIDCVNEPDARTVAMLGMVRDQIAFQGIGFELGVHDSGASASGGGSCGHGCGCHE